MFLRFRLLPHISQLSRRSTNINRRLSGTPLVFHDLQNLLGKAKGMSPKTSIGNNSATTISDLNVLRSAPPPASAIETIYNDGFLLSNGVQFRDESGVLIIHDEAFKWRPVLQVSRTEEKALKTGQLELGIDVWGVLDVVHPKPELLVIGTGKRTLQLSNTDRDTITELGIRIDAMDTSHAVAQFNLLATERPKGQIAAALLFNYFGVD